MNDSIVNDQTLTWSNIFSRSWLSLTCILFILLCLTVIGLFFIPHFSLDITSTKSKVLSSSSAQSQTSMIDLPEWLIPEPLPFPKVPDLANPVRKRFKIPEAEFTLALKHPASWQMLAIAGDTVRFQTRDQGKKLNQGQEYLSFSAGCFGDCEKLENNIAESLAQHVERDYHRGLDPRVLHWYVHHKTWVEYSLLYRQSDGTAWMIGSSVRWSPEWLNVLKCTYRAPVNFPYENEKVLHLAWDRWASEFIRYCRNYEVLSWD